MADRGVTTGAGEVTGAEEQGGRGEDGVEAEAPESIRKPCKKDANTT